MDTLWIRHVPARYVQQQSRTGPSRSENVRSHNPARIVNVSGPFVDSGESLSEATVRRMRVILCDDHKSLTAALADALRRLGHESVLIADRPDQALSAAAETSVDVVVMDLAFPTGDGFAAAEALRRLPSAPQVLCSLRAPTATQYHSRSRLGHLAC